MEMGVGPELVDAMMHVLKACNIQSELILCEAGSEYNGRNMVVLHTFLMKLQK